MDKSNGWNVKIVSKSGQSIVKIVKCCEHDALYYHKMLINNKKYISVNNSIINMFVVSLMTFIGTY